MGLSTPPQFAQFVLGIACTIMRTLLSIHSTFSSLVFSSSLAVDSSVRPQFVAPNSSPLSALAAVTFGGIFDTSLHGVAVDDFGSDSPLEIFQVWG
jgi:hypothetical protein